MSAFPRIVCAVDFSEASLQALRYAAMFARCGDSDLRVVHATYFEPPLYFTQGQMEELRAQAQHSRAAAEAALRAFVTEATGDDALPIQLLEGPAAETVVEAVRKMGAYLLAMGTHGRTGFNRLMLGSIAEKLMRMSPVPVLAVRRGSDAATMRHILCPVNNTSMARSALRTAAELAACTRARLTVLHVREPGGAAPISDVCDWMQGEPLPGGCEIHDLAREGDAATEIISTSSETAADLIVLGASHKRFFDTTVLGSTTVRVTRHAPVPVLVAFTASEMGAGA